MTSRRRLAVGLPVDERIFFGFAELLPELPGFQLGPDRVGTQPGLPLVQQRRLRNLQTLEITSDQDGRGLAVIHRAIRSDPDAGREPDQIEHIGHHGRFVEIVDAPDETAVGVTPGAEIFQMQIADAEYLRRIHQVRAPGADFLRPAEIGCPQEHEGVGLHQFVFGLDIVGDDVALRRQPGLVVGVVFDKGHRELAKRVPASLASIERDPTPGCVAAKPRCPAVIGASVDAAMPRGGWWLVRDCCNIDWQVHRRAAGGEL